MSIYYPYFKDNKWKVFHLGHEKEFKDLAEAERYCNMVNYGITEVQVREARQ